MNGILPVIGDGQTSYPFGRVVLCAIGEFAARPREICRERLIGSHHQMNRPGQHERRLAVDIGQGRVGREPDDDIASPEGDVIAAGKRSDRCRSAENTTRSGATQSGRAPLPMTAGSSPKSFIADCFRPGRKDTQASCGPQRAN
jgi:hypothetical protein